ncbi:MAG TPA: CmcI family methyltransferase [Xanthobacteraceae bacterium]|nr:CmcI family methyltransferase [Xanthobacteraceae bacterium]
MTAPALISGNELKAAAARFTEWQHENIPTAQRGAFSVFDKWFTRVTARFAQLDPSKSWEESVGEQGAPGLAWELLRLRQFLDRWARGRLVSFAERDEARVNYDARFGTEFGVDVLLACQGAPNLMRWRGLPLFKTAFDFAIYPQLMQELRPRTIFEIGSGSGASALWLADLTQTFDLDAMVHSVDIRPAAAEHARVRFYRGDCREPGGLFPAEVIAQAPHPWLVIEDAHQNVAGVLAFFHERLQSGDYLVVEDSDVKRDVLAAFDAAHPGQYMVDTRYTDFFGRNATCANDSIFVRQG